MCLRHHHHQVTKRRMFMHVLNLVAIESSCHPQVDANISFDNIQQHHHINLVSMVVVNHTQAIRTIRWDFTNELATEIQIYLVVMVAVNHTQAIRTMHWNFTNELATEIQIKLGEEFLNNITRMHLGEVIEQCDWYVHRCKQIYAYTEDSSKSKRTFSTSFAMW